MVRVALGQFDAVVGDLSFNGLKMREIYHQALARQVDLLVFPELAVCGYTPEDLLLSKHFLQDVSAALEKLASDCPEITMVVGFAEDYEDTCYNSAAILQQGRIRKIYRKSRLVNAGVFDELRYFRPGTEPLIMNMAGLNVAFTVCADIWDTQWLGSFLCSSLYRPPRSSKPARAKSGSSRQDRIQLIVNISASPFHIGKHQQRQAMLSACAKQFDCVVCYCNLVGGQDELVFDGRSMFMDTNGNVVSQAKAFEEDLVIAEITASADGMADVRSGEPAEPQPLEEIDELYRALVLGTRDYTRKNGFEKVLLGLSGGIDSSVTAAIAVAALGAENVLAVTMPSQFTSADTIADAQKVADNLGIKLLTVPIESILANFDSALKKIAGWQDKGIAYENLQARIRGCLLMTLSNLFGFLVLTCGNKSETAVGYVTVFGDTAGGFAVMKDVPKTLVYKVAKYVNQIFGRVIIPEAVIKRAPSAELRAGQKDSDDLPEYDVLDMILADYLLEEKSAKQIVAEGFDEELVRSVMRMVNRSEYKRRLSPLGIKVTPNAFGRDRRLPVTNRYRPYDSGP